MQRIAASSYSNTAPLIWSFLYGSQHGRVEIILDNAPARSAELLSQDRVDAALVPVIAYHTIDDVKLVPDVCVAAKERVRSVCLVTRDKDLADVRSVALDASSRTSVLLTKIIFREFLGFEPAWTSAEPDLEKMLGDADCALLIGDPALSIADCGLRNADFESPSGLSETTLSSRSARNIRGADRDESAIHNPQSAFRKFDLVEIWRRFTDTGFVFAMWMTRLDKPRADFAAARDEGLTRIDEIVSNYLPDIKIGAPALRHYLSENISYSIDDDLQRGMELYFDLAKKHALCENIRELKYTS